jgi:hypothetical protein
MKLPTILKTACSLVMVVLLSASDCREDDGYYGFGSYVPGFVGGGGYGGGGFADPCYCDGGYGGYYDSSYFETSYYYDDWGYYDDDDRTKIPGKRKK